MQVGNLQIITNFARIYSVRYRFWLLGFSSAGPAPAEAKCETISEFLVGYGDCSELPLRGCDLSATQSI